MAKIDGNDEDIDNDDGDNRWNANDAKMASK